MATTEDMVQVKKELPDMMEPSKRDSDNVLEGEFISPQELLRQHMTTSAVETLTLNLRPKKQKPPKKIEKFNVERFPCEKCYKEFSNKELLKVHLKIHGKGYPFKCDKCDQRFKVKKYLQVHFKRVHGDRKKHQCEDCGKYFFTKYHLTMHRYIHTGEKPFVCDICDKGFNRLEVLKSHKRIHSDEKPYKCSFCSYACRDKSTLRKHEAVHMDSAKTYTCNICHRVFKEKWRLKQHVADKHLSLAVKVYECDVCRYQFKSRQGIVTHIKAVHKKLKPFKCDVCRFECSTLNNMEEHKRRHSDMKPYKCTDPDCDKRFKTKCDMSRHSKIHRPESQYPCPICDKLFTRRPRMLVHMAQHAPKWKRIPCQHCGVRFYNESYLTKHIKYIHSKQRPYYQCDYCGFKVYNKPGLAVHIKNIHMKGKKHQCRVCGMKFKNLTPMKVHRWEKHRIQYKWQLKKSVDEPKVVEIKEEIIDVEDHVLDPETSDLKKIGTQNVELVDVKDLNTILYSGDILSEDLAKAVITKNSKNLRNIPEEVFDQFFIGQVSLERNNRRDINNTMLQKKSMKMRQKKESFIQAKLCLEDILERVREQIQGKAQVRARQTGRPRRNLKMVDYSYMNENDNCYDESGKKKTTAEGNKKKVELRHHKNELILNETSQNGVLDNIQIKNVQGKYGKYYQVKFNTVQCYMCFKLFENQEQLIKHCKEHFAVNSKKHSCKCPFCDYQSSGNSRKSLFTHMKSIHNVCLNNRSSKLRVKRDDNKIKFVARLLDKPRNKAKLSERDRNINNNEVKEIEVIPTVENMNRQAYMELDRKKREEKNKTMLKSKLVRKGNEWVVESVPIEVEKNEIEDLITKNSDNTAKIDREDLTKDPYLEKLTDLSKKAKREGRKMFFPCDKCKKVCQALCGLKLHRRVHNTNAVPFKPKVWKHKQEGTAKVKIDIVKPIDNSKPKPIKGRHYCDDKLKRFYENCIRGENIQFEQFLKIYNKIDRDNVKEFDPAEDHRQNNIPTVECVKKTVVSRKRLNKNPKLTTKYTRVVRMSKKMHLKRVAIIRKLRENISVASVNI